MPSQIPLPHLRSLVLGDDEQLIKVFDFTDIEKLEIILDRFPGSEFSPTCLPSQINTLSLTEGIWSLGVEHSPHLMSNLASLCLKKLQIEISLQAHLELPNLKHLELDNVSFKSPNHGAGATHSGDVPTLRAGMLFSPKHIVLERLSLRHIAVDETLVLELRGYPNLSSLTIQEADSGSLFLAISEHLNTNDEFFPALRTIKLECFWKENLTGAYEALFDSCTSRKPHVDLHLVRNRIHC
jgi:hypothetical protein